MNARARKWCDEAGLKRRSLHGIRKGLSAMLVGPEGRRKATGTGLILLAFTVPRDPQNGHNGIKRLQGECPTGGKGDGMRVLPLAERSRDTHNAAPGRSPSGRLFPPNPCPIGPLPPQPRHARVMAVSVVATHADRPSAPSEGMDARCIP